MLISGEKGDSETDSTDLIIYGLAQDCGWNKIQKKLKSMHPKGLQNKEYLSVYTAAKWKTFCQKKLIHVGALHKCWISSYIQLTLH